MLPAAFEELAPRRQPLTNLRVHTWEGGGPDEVHLSRCVKRAGGAGEYTQPVGEFTQPVAITHVTCTEGILRLLSE